MEEDSITTPVGRITPRFPHHSSSSSSVSHTSSSPPKVPSRPQHPLQAPPRAQYPWSPTTTSSSSRGVFERALRGLEEHDGAVDALLPLEVGGVNGVLAALRERAEDIEPLAKFLLSRNEGEGLPTAKLSDDAIAGSDALATSLVLAEAIKKVGQPDIVLFGLASTDGGMSVVPAMVAERLGLPQVTQVSTLEVADGGDDVLAEVLVPEPRGHGRGDTGRVEQSALADRGHALEVVDLELPEAPLDGMLLGLMVEAAAAAGATTGRRTFPCCAG